MPNGQVLVVDLMDLMLLFLCIVWSETVIISFFSSFIVFLFPCCLCYTILFGE